MTQILFVRSPLGTAKIVGDENGISEITILDDDEPRAKSEQTDQISKPIPKQFEEVVSQLSDYFLGKRKDFTFKLNPKGTDFQQKVWQELLNIPYGKTMSYMDLSKKLGDIKAIRAVASANGKNPLWIVIPCHSVIGTDGSLTGYAGGLWRKKWLLEHENPTNQQSLF
jgi:methylated-DNA-[protein]-cysteine S-methyltransferase